MARCQKINEVTMTSKSIPVYPWFDQVPNPNFKTKRQLAELGLRPGGEIRAKVVWNKGRKFANLYDVSEAKPRQQPSTAQLAALEKAQLARRTCPACKTVLSYIPGRWTGDCPVCVSRARVEELAEVERKARLWLSPDTVILDTETTSLDGYLVQIAAINPAGEILLDTLVNPHEPISIHAHAIHGITAEQVANAPTFAELADQISALLHGKRVVTYNAEFDEGILRNEIHRYAHAKASRFGMPAPFHWAWNEAIHWNRLIRWRCAMKLYAVYHGEYSEYHEDYQSQSLPGGDHSALGDCRATLALLQEMANEPTEKATQ
jgi:hypothetical protein